MRYTDDGDNPKLTVLAPFDEETEKLLLEFDQACRMQSEVLLKAMERSSLAGEEYVMTIETMVWWKAIKAYGILMNRAINAGWVRGVVTEEK